MHTFLPQRLQQSFRAVLFDLDGTLIDSEPLHYGAFKQALKEYGYDLDSLGDAVKYGGSFRKMFAAIAAKFNLADDIFEEIYQRKVEITLEHPAYDVPLVEGAVSFLELLKEQNLPLGIVTNSEQAYLEYVLDAFDLRQYFTHYVHSGLIMNPKPAPDGYEYGRKLLQLPADHILVFENTDAGILAAKTAGHPVIAIRNTDHLGLSNYEEADLGVDHFGDAALDDLIWQTPN